MTKQQAKETIARVENIPRHEWSATDRQERLAAISFLTNAAKSNLSPERRALHKARKAWFARNGY